MAPPWIASSVASLPPRNDENLGRDSAKFHPALAESRLDPPKHILRRSADGQKARWTILPILRTLPIYDAIADVI